MALTAMMRDADPHTCRYAVRPVYHAPAAPQSKVCLIALPTISVAAAAALSLYRVVYN